MKFDNEPDKLHFKNIGVRKCASHCIHTSNPTKQRVWVLTPTLQLNFILSAPRWDSHHFLLLADLTNANNELGAVHWNIAAIWVRNVATERGLRDVSLASSKCEPLCRNV